MKKLHIVDHPAVLHKLLYLRDATTAHWEFEKLLSEITLFLAVEATRNLETMESAVKTPLEKTTVGKLKKPITLISILRAGLGMIPAFKQLFPLARVGLIGLARDEETLEPNQYYKNLPETIENDYVFLLDPMLATVGSMSYAISSLKERGTRDLAVISILAAPEGVRRVHSDHPDVPIHTAFVDRELNERGYILPGLGDAGDRIFGNLA
jgi:uracil phosphoribosyltransferase